MKRGKKTVLLFADPAEALDTLKHNLIDALKATNQSNQFDGVAIPSSPSDVEIGKPVEPLDISKGWELVDPSFDDELAMDDSDSKSKKGKSRAKTKDMSLKALGIKENYVLAFRFRNDEDETMEDDQGWDVNIPTYEDLYGVENVGDVGVIPEYRG